MLVSEVRLNRERPTLWIDHRPVAAMAYTTYFEERSRYEDFLDAGYRIFFVNASFTDLPINSEKTGFTPFNVGIFEDPDHPDYSEFEDAVYKILKKTPDAIIFPRIYISMPKWWVDQNPDEVVPTKKAGMREILFSDRFRKDGGDLLRKLIAHVRSSDYSDRVGGWQICGGQTQEWFFPDMKGGLCAGAEKYYRRWIKETYGEDHATLPAYDEFQYRGNPRQESENARRYCLFCNLGVAESLDYFASIVKEETNHTQIVGSFYGYTFESNNTVLFGSHGLRRLLDSPNLDFFSSPNAYTQNRAFGIDWADMVPVDSLKLHGKLAFIECDIRTYLTTSIQRARPGRYPDDIYKTANGTSVWEGPPTAELSREALRKCFAHQISKASAVWWFDMWGGWYHDPLLMAELKSMKEIYDSEASDKDGAWLTPDVAVFADETAYANMLSESPQLSGHFTRGGVNTTRTEMGNVGTPYDLFMVEDAPTVLSRYRAAVFPFPIPSPAGERALALCRSLKIPYLCATPEHSALSAEEIRAFLVEHGVHCYSELPNVVYAGNGYFGLHSAQGGPKSVRFPTTVHLRPVFGADVPEQTCDSLEFDLPENGTALFAVELKNQ
ncbi:MAG: hypothetical protein II337_03515 [Clostridia bacterium]|nr:hypothetical protein [Clostridia bacterium]